MNRSEIRTGQIGVIIVIALLLSACRLDEERASSDAPFATDPAAIARPLSPNLLRNPSFEVLDSSRRPLEWNVPSAPLMVFDGKSAHSGNVAVGSSPTSYFSTTLPVTAGRAYTLGYYSRSDKPGKARLQINWALANGSVVSSASVAPTTEKWTWNEYSVSAPPMATAAAIYLVAPDDTLAWYDDVWFGQGRRAHPALPR
jgi:hypothetical protein